MHQLMIRQSHLVSKPFTAVTKYSMSFQISPSVLYSNHAQHLPKFKIKGENVKILQSPTEFYNTLQILSKKARKRIVISSLYLGTGQLEKNLVNSWQEAALENKDLKLHVLLDYNRGSRGTDNSRTLLLPLMKTMKENMRVSLYHTPYLRGFLKFLLPVRWNELVGLNHMKIYLFDDSVIISGANLSDQYFVNRQDRYMLFKDCTQLADFFHELVKTVSTFSFQLQNDDSVKLDPSWKIHPYKDNLKNFKSTSKSLVSDFLLKWSNISEENSIQTDTVVYPQLQMGELDIDHDVVLTTDLFKSAVEGSIIKLSTGYFNLHSVYKECLLRKSQAHFQILMSSPQANGFFGASGMSRAIPSAYTYLAYTFYNRIRKKIEGNQNIQLYEFSRDGWTFHAKGLWCYQPNSVLPNISLIGSPNFGYRSVTRDLECQVCIMTNNENLQDQLHQEQQVLFELSDKMTAKKYAKEKVPLWVKLVTYIWPSLF